MVRYFSALVSRRVRIYNYYAGGVVITISNCQAMDALTEEKAEDRAAFQARLLQMDSDHAEAIHQASLNLDQALQARISYF